MRWLKVSVETNPGDTDPVSDCLYSLGLPDIEIIDSQAERRAFLDAHRDLWDYVAEEALAPARPAVNFYVPDSAAGEELLARVRAALARLLGAGAGCGPDGPIVRVERVCDDDWADNWKEYFQPVNIGERLLLWPQWRGAEPPAGRTPLRVDNAALFGTGQHATTRLCLRAVEQLTRPGCSVLDLGAGSGILFIAALLLGAARAEAAEMNTAAAGVVPANAALNGVGAERYRLHITDILRDATLWADWQIQGFDLVTANMVQDVITALAARVAAVLTPGGRLVVSGILAAGADETRRCLEQQALRVTDLTEQDGWCALVAAKSGTEKT
ncbi:MAG: 50S ribosomal protein L11 methyltransferase [Gracilibacteraceae bacterium]|nr:50S ribosomal protein L11 methyltransferase [Gracilibacteraceae bacterium]